METRTYEINFRNCLKSFWNFRGHRVLSCVAISASLTALAAGAVVGWALGPHPDLGTASLPHGMARGGFWVHWGLVAGAAAAAIYSAALADHIGRRQILVWAAWLCIAFWMGNLLFEGAELLGRAEALALEGPRLWRAALLAALGGHALGAVLVVLPLYLGEVAPLELRGALGGSVALALTLGALAQELLRTLLPPALNFVAQASVPVLFAVLGRWLPQSPAWLTARGRDREALFALMTLRMSSEPSDLQAELTDKQVSAWPAKEFREPCLDLFQRTGTRKALCSVLAVLFFCQVGSFAALPYYACGVFSDDSYALKMQELWLTWQAVGTALSLLVVDALGRRPLLAASGVGVALTAFALGGIAITSGIDAVEAPNDWKTIYVIRGYAASLGLGLAPLPWTLLGDLFAAHARAHAGTAALVLWAALQMAAPQLRLIVLATSDDTTTNAPSPLILTYCISGVAGALACAYALFVLPESARRHVSVLLRELEERRERADARERLQRRTQSLPAPTVAPCPQGRDALCCLDDLVDIRGGVRALDVGLTM